MFFNFLTGDPNIKQSLVFFLSAKVETNTVMAVIMKRASIITWFLNDPDSN